MAEEKVCQKAMNSGQNNSDYSVLIRKSRKAKAKYQRDLTLMSVPLIIKTIIFSIVPLLWLPIAFEFYIPNKGVFESPWVGLDNFKYLFDSGKMQQMLINAFLLNVLDIGFGTLVGVILGLLMFEITSKWQLKVMQTIYFFPYFITWVVVGVLLKNFIGNEGVITQFIRNASGDTYDFYQQPELWKGILCLAGVWKGAGVSGVVNYAVLLGVDKSYYEAAELDGANRFQKMIHLSIPHMKSMIIINIIMSCSNLIRYDFSKVYFLTDNQSTLYETTEVIETYMYRALRTSGLYEPSTAAGLFQSLVGLILCFITNMIVKKISPENSLF